MGVKLSKTTNQQLPSPLVEPAISGNADLIKYLIGRHIASYDTSEVSNNSRFDPKLQSYVNATDNEGNTPLIGAVYGGHKELVSFLMEKCGADITIKNNMGCSPMWIACGYSKLTIIEYLIHSLFHNKHREDFCITTIAKILSEVNNSGDSPFLAAVSKGYIDVLKLLYTAMDKCNEEENQIIMNEYKWNLLFTKNKAGDTPLSVAVGAGCDCNMEVLKYLLDKEESCITEIKSSVHKKLLSDHRPLNSPNANGLTPIIIACERNNVPVLEELYKRGAILSDTDSNGRSPLAISSFCGCFEVVQYLLSIEEGRELLNKKDCNECTPIWLAARTGNLKITKVLLSEGADLSMKGIDNLSVMDVAKKYKKDAVVNYLANLDQH